MKRDFIAITDFTAEELSHIFDLSIKLKKEFLSGGNQPILKNRVMAMVFQKPSLRTRISFDMAMRHLGGDALNISPNEIGLGQRESIADVARVLSGYVQVIMARVFSHDHVLELAKWASVPIINGLSDYNHPCQAMADALTILERFGTLQGLNVTFIGDGNNVAVSLIHICAKMGANFTIASPEGYDLKPEPIQLAERIAATSGSKFRFVRDPHVAAQDADVLYTDTWTSMGQEAETQIRLKAFQGYQVNAELVAMARAHAIVMHCLPAHRGQELTDDVADGDHSAIFPQAHNRMHAQKGILAFLFEG